MENKSLIVSLIFKKTLHNLLSENEGMIVSIENDMKPMFPGVEKIIVFKHDNEIDIISYDGELKNGEFIDLDYE